MNAFETTAIVDDASHLTLREPVPASFTRECRVIVFLDTEKKDENDMRWPAAFFEEILIADPSFTRPSQGDLPPIAALDA